MEYLWFMFAILSALTAALVAVFAKIGLEKIDPNIATALRAVIMAIFLVAVVAIEGKLMKISSIVLNSKAFYYILLSGIAGALSWLFYFLAIKAGSVSKVVAIDRLSIVFVVILAFFFLGEKLNMKEIAGIGLIVIGAILLVLK